MVAVVGELYSCSRSGVIKLFSSFHRAGVRCVTPFGGNIFTCFGHNHKGLNCNYISFAPPVPQLICNIYSAICAMCALSLSLSRCLWPTQWITANTHEATGSFIFFSKIVNVHRLGSICQWECTACISTIHLNDSVLYTNDISGTKVNTDQYGYRYLVHLSFRCTCSSAMTTVQQTKILESK